MTSVRTLGLAALALVVASGAVVRADVKAEEKSLVKFEGTLGRMMGLFGGKAASEGLVSTVAVRGDRKMTVNEMTGHIVDLAEEKIYDLDMRRRTYTVTTFDELRRRLQETRDKAKQGAAGQDQPRERPADEPEFEVDFDLRESGQRRTINGYDCREVVTTITVRQKGKTLDEGGDLVMTTSSWLTDRIGAMQEIADFDRRYAQKMGDLFAVGAGVEQMAAAMAMLPAMKEAFARVNAENANLDGTAIQTVMTVENVRNPQEATVEQPEDAPGVRGGVGGLLGGLGRKMARRAADKQAAEPRSTVMTVTHEVLKVSTDVAASDLAIPAGFKQRN